MRGSRNCIKNNNNNKGKEIEKCILLCFLFGHNKINKRIFIIRKSWMFLIFFKHKSSKKFKRILMKIYYFKSSDNLKIILKARTNIA